jgi:hypothetical protein
VFYTCWQLFRGATLFILVAATADLVHAADLNLAWDSATVSGLTGYKVYYGTSSRNYSTSTSVGLQTTYAVTGLAPGAYYFAVTALSSSGESSYSNEVSTTISGTIAPTLTSHKLSSMVSVDGVLAEPFWNQAQSVVFSNSAQSDNRVKTLTLWDDSTLFFAFDVTDANFEAVNGNLWLDDGVEVYLDTANNKSLSMDADDVQFIATINDLVSKAGVVSRTLRTSTGYITEVGIPWSVLQVTPAHGKRIGLLFANNDRDAGTFHGYDWLNIGASGSYRRPYLWGELVLGSTLSATVPNPLPAPTNVSVK